MSPPPCNAVQAPFSGWLRECLSLVALLAVLATLFAAVAGCSGEGHRSSREAIPTASCGQERLLAGAPLAGESVYRAGPLTLAVTDYRNLAKLGRRQLAHPLGSKVIAVLKGHGPVVVAVDRASQGQFSLQFTPERGLGFPVARIRDGRPAVRFPACGRGPHRFAGGILFAGPGCMRLRVQPTGEPPIPLGIPIGTSPSGCQTMPAAQQLGTSALPYLGISCRLPNSIVCDRVGVGVWLDRPAKRVTVAVAGRVVSLRLSTHNAHRQLWLGYLRDAGLRHEPLDVHLPAGQSRWYGSPLIWVRVKVTARLPNGTPATVAGSAQLHAGFG